MSTQQQPPTKEQIEYARWLEEIRRRDAHRAHDREAEFHRYVNEGAVRTGQATLYASMIVNGVACVSLLTFIGTLPTQQKHEIANTLVWFASGAALAVAAKAASYFADLLMATVSLSMIREWQHPYVRPGPKTRRFQLLNKTFHILAVVLGVASLAVFVVGMLEVRAALTHL